VPENQSASPLDGKFQADVVHEGATSTLVLAGEFDLSGIDTARAKLTEARDGDSSQVVIDLSRLTFIDSTGIAFLVAAVKEDDERLLGFIPCKAYAVQRVLSVTGVSKMVDAAASE